MTEAQFDDEEAFHRMVRRIPAGHTGELDEFASVVTFLCSAESAYVTGETIAVDGGETF